MGLEWKVEAVSGGGGSDMHRPPDPLNFTAWEWSVPDSDVSMNTYSSRLLCLLFGVGL